MMESWEKMLGMKSWPEIIAHLLGQLFYQTLKFVGALYLVKWILL